MGHPNPMPRTPGEATQRSATLRRIGRAEMFRIPASKPHCRVLRTALNVTANTAGR